MIKRIVKYGSSLCIVFRAEDRKLYNIKEGEIYDVEMTLMKPENLNKMRSDRKN